MSAANVDPARFVVNPDDRIPDHLETADWLTRGGSEIIGYLYNRAQMRSHVARHRRGGQVARPTAEESGSFTGNRAWDESFQPSQQPQR
jgi:hypothetical protein